MMIQQVYEACPLAVVRMVTDEWNDYASIAESEKNRKTRDENRFARYSHKTRKDHFIAHSGAFCS